MNQTVAQSTEGVQIKRTALVVDDLDDMLDLLEIALNAANFRVLRASTTAEAIELFGSRASDIDLLMTDLRVGMDSGLELARKLISAKPSLQVLAISGYALEGQVITSNGRIEFLPKPFSTSELKNKLNTIFSPELPPLTFTVSGQQNGGFTLSTNCQTATANPKPERSE